MDFVTRVMMKTAKSKKWMRKSDDFTTGDTVNVHVKIKEGEKERVQLYKGVVVKLQGEGLGRTFTVRKISSGVGVERTFPYMSPNIEKVEIVNRGHVRRSRLYFLRGLSGRAARLESDLVIIEGDAAAPETEAAAAAAPSKAEKTEKK